MSALTFRLGRAIGNVRAEVADESLVVGGIRTPWAVGSYTVSDPKVGWSLLATAGQADIGWGTMEIELAKAVAAVRDELLEAAARGVGQDLAFKVGPVELEFAVELRTDAKAKTGFKAWVVTGDVEAGMARARTHRVKITVTPQRPGGEDVLIHGSADRLRGPGDVSGHIEN
ncbi:trypco2 family protein [Streptomyces sp. NBC_01208]|uniref:trypco2 family protein n=1 Tax=Streptomyces sp. NBC_01208 TaxID=2903773 RepID=UPI002E1484E7